MDRWNDREKIAFEKGFKRAVFMYRQLLLIRSVMKKKHRREILDCEEITLRSHGFERSK